MPEMVDILHSKRQVMHAMVVFSEEVGGLGWHKPKTPPDKQTQ
jgi:hypothetical protein